jgi:hypothetical protein
MSFDQKNSIFFRSKISKIAYSPDQNPLDKPAKLYPVWLLSFDQPKNENAGKKRLKLFTCMASEF